MLEFSGKGWVGSKIDTIPIDPMKVLSFFCHDLFESHDLFAYLFSILFQKPTWIKRCKSFFQVSSIYVDKKFFPNLSSDEGTVYIYISGWWLNHPSEKYERQIGNLPQIGVKIKNI